MSNVLNSYRDGKSSVTFIPKKGEVMDTCATISDKYVCCNVQVIKSVSNCPFDCSYCFLQDYLNDGTTKVIQDIDAIMTEVRLKTESQPNRLFRIGTWELGDSLALDHQVGQAAKLIEAFTTIPNAILELKTKSDVVDPIINIDHQCKTVVSWSFNSDYIIDTEEHKTASLKRRLNALSKVSQAGYLVGLHFDPMILYPDWKMGYSDLVDAIFACVHPNQIAWISIGSLRFKPEMKKKMENNFPGSSITVQEMVLGDDGKLRYVKPIRVEMYLHLMACLNRYINADNLVYLCMERWDMWDRIFNYHPESIAHLDYLFAESLYHRYPQLSLSKPQRDDYQ